MLEHRFFNKLLEARAAGLREIQKAHAFRRRLSEASSDLL
jgi:hypothetical protein